MINVILVDDEKPALRELEFLLKKYPEISVIAMYKDPFEALENIERMKPDVVFLDINMPKLKGTDAALRISEVSPDTNIVFVTAYDQYAIEAFELHALDYILKPVQIERFDKTIERIIKKKPQITREPSKKLIIKCLGRLQIGWEGENPIKWRTEKTKELFAFLLQNQGRDISKENLLDKLCDDEYTDKSIKQLYNGIYYIRKALENYGVDRSLINISNNYNMMIGDVEYDLRRFYELYNNLDKLTLEETKELEALYEGDYLDGENYSWAVLERDTLSKMYEQCVTRLSGFYILNMEFSTAEKILKRAFNKNPYSENITEILLGLYKETGNRLDATKHFNTYSKLIKQGLGIMPDDRICELADFRQNHP